MLIYFIHLRAYILSEEYNFSSDGARQFYRHGQVEAITYSGVALGNWDR